MSYSMSFWHFDLSDLPYHSIFILATMLKDRDGWPQREGYQDSKNGIPSPPPSFCLPLSLCVFLTPSEQANRRTRHRVRNHRYEPGNTTHNSTSFLSLSPSCPQVTGPYSTWRMGVAVSFPFTATSLCGPRGKTEQKRARGMRTTSIREVGCYPMTKAWGCNWWRYTRLLLLLRFYELHSRPLGAIKREGASNHHSHIATTVLVRVQRVWRVTRGQTGEIFSQGHSKNERATFHTLISAFLFFSVVILDVGHGINAKSLAVWEGSFIRSCKEGCRFEWIKQLALRL